MTKTLAVIPVNGTAQHEIRITTTIAKDAAELQTQVRENGAWRRVGQTLPHFAGIFRQVDDTLGVSAQVVGDVLVSRGHDGPADRAFHGDRDPPPRGGAARQQPAQAPAPQTMGHGGLGVIADRR